jgi:hypothetical protein
MKIMSSLLTATASMALSIARRSSVNAFAVVGGRTGNAAVLSNCQRIFMSPAPGLAQLSAFGTTTVITRRQMSSETSSDVDLDVAALEQQIAAKGLEIRQLKEDGVTDKLALAPYVEELLALKAKLPQKEAPPKKKKIPAPQKEKRAPREKKKAESDMTEDELKQTRLDKVKAMREAGVEPYEYTYDPNRTAGQLQSEYEGRLEGGEEDETSNVAVAGRVMAKRVFGKLAFFTLQDESGLIQLQLEKNRLGDSFKVRSLFILYLCHDC